MSFRRAAAGGGSNGGGGGGTWLPVNPNIVTTSQSPQVNTASWNLYNAAGKTETLPADTMSVPHAVAWYGSAANAPTVAPPAGWHLWSPTEGKPLAVNATYLYDVGPGQSIVWQALPSVSVFFPVVSG